MNKYLVIGNPIEHSLSPKLHNYWIKKNNLNAIYEKKKVEEKDLKKLCDDVREGKIEGFNVTVPFKEKIIKYLDGFTDTALAVKAVNTVFRKYEDGEYIAMGDNTDVYGFEQSCPLKNNSKRGASALIIGAGGASKAIILGLFKLNVKRLAITNRTREKAEVLMNQIVTPESFRGHFVYEWCKDEGSMSKPDIVVNCTSLGLKKEDRIPLDFSKYKKRFFTKKVIFYDLIYNPEETDFLLNAKKIGQQAINGKMMFLYQAQKSFTIWHGIKPEINHEVISLLNA
jgi:shikimate dehydrogenase